MKPFLFKNPKFIKTALKPAQYPILKDSQGNFLPEIAVFGRSNVGKSSLLNDLFKAKNLVKTSSKPGKTQCLNFFTLDERLTFVDLPGYGFAEVPIQVRKNWGPMVQTYLDGREELKLTLFLFDIRRKPVDEDIELLEWIAKANKAVILVLTKVDKVGRSELASNTQQILKAFGCENLHYVHYSVPKKVGRHPLTQMINDALQSECEDNETN